MNIFRPLRRCKRAASTMAKVLRLRSMMALLLAIVVYTLVSQCLWSPSYCTVSDQEGMCTFFSTDCRDPLRSSLVHAIEQADHSITLLIYSLSDKKLINALRDAALRGVAVTIIHDAIETPDCSFLLGRKIRCYPRRAHGLMHNKLLVIDHAQVWIGSANMSTTSLTEQGNLVVALSCRAVAETIELLAEAMMKQVPYSHPPLQVAFPEATLTLFFHPFHSEQSFRSLLERIEKATQRIFVAMFTFTHPALVAALCRAKCRGVDVRIVFDKDSSLQTSRKSYIKFKREGIPAGYRTKRGLLHYKVAVIDNSLLAGSCNWTKAGFTANHEAMLFIDPIPPSQQQWIERWWQQVERASTLKAP